MSFISKVFSKKIDESVHMQFQKFSRGEFRNRAIINARRSGDRYTIKTSYEFANELVREAAEILGKGKAEVTGAIVSTNDMKSILEFKEIKQFQGVKKYMIGKVMSGEEIISLLDRFPKAFFALSFAAGNTSLKIKPKSPKSAKPGTKGEEAPKPDFCTLATDSKKIAQEFIFEVPDFKKAEANHTFMIEEIVVPSNLKNEKDYSVIREKALRKGRILRQAVIDERPYKEDVAFEA